MKNLLSTITISALVGTNASNLKPVFTNATVSHGLKSNQLNNKDISITNQNVSNPFIPKQLTSLNEQGIGGFAVDSSGTIYAGTTDGLYKSTDGINFQQVNDKLNASVNDIAIQNTTIYVSTNNNGLWKSNDKGTFDKINEQNYIRCLTLDSSETIYAGTKWKGLYKSIDGINFNKIDTINNSIITGILITKTKIIYISTNGDGLWKSNDKGTFDKINESPNNIIDIFRN